MEAKEENMSYENKVWYYYGKGIDSFGKNGEPEKEDIQNPGPNEVLARVDALALCASDNKMINMGNDFPLFNHRDFEKNPLVLGHELSLTVEKAGSNLEKHWKKGMRMGIQPDVYMNNIRYCIGVHVPGGMQHYILLKKSVFHSDHGATAFEVNDDLSYSSVAQLEPNACVEAAYRPWGRKHFNKKGTLLIYVGKQGDAGYIYDELLDHEEVILWSEGEIINQYPENTVRVHSLKEAKELSPMGFSDVLIVGNAKQDVLENVIQSMKDTAVFCWLSDGETNQQVRIDIAQVHYGKINWLGSKTKKLSDAFQRSRQRYELKQDGNLLIMGGAGAMGRMHVMRALMQENGPQTIVVTARSNERLEALKKDFQEIAVKKQKRLEVVATNEADWKEKLSNYTNSQGFDDVVVSAPGIDPVEKAVSFLKKDGMLILFSGTKHGSFVKIPLGYIPSYGARLNASSGSSVEDEKSVLRKQLEHQIDLDKNVMAVAGFNYMKEAIKAVNEGRFPGKIIVYPHLDNLPLIDLRNPEGLPDSLKETLKNCGWGKQAENELFQYYKSQLINVKKET